MFKPLSLTARLSAATGIFWLGFVILAALSLQGLHSMSRDLQLVHDTHMQASQAAARSTARSSSAQVQRRPVSQQPTASRVGVETA